MLPLFLIPQRCIACQFCAWCRECGLCLQKFILWIWEVGSPFGGRWISSVLRLYLEWEASLKSSVSFLLNVNWILVQKTKNELWTWQLLYLALLTADRFAFGISVNFLFLSSSECLICCFYVFYFVAVHCNSCRIIEFRKRSLRSSSPTINLTLPDLPLNYDPKCHSCNTSSTGDSTTSLGSLFQCLTTLSMKKIYYMHSKPPWCNLRLFPLILLRAAWEKRATPSPLTISFQVIVESKTVVHPASMWYVFPNLQDHLPQAPEHHERVQGADPGQKPENSPVLRGDDDRDTRSCQLCFFPRELLFRVSWLRGTCGKRLRVVGRFGL